MGKLLGKMNFGWVLDQIGQNGIFELLWEGLFGAIFGGFLGALLGLVTFFVAKRFGGYHWGWRYAGPLRVVTAVLMTLALGFLGSLYGLLGGARDGIEGVLKTSPLAQESMPFVGEACADMVAQVTFVSDEQLAKKGMKAAEELSTEELDRFRANELELDLDHILARFAKLEEVMLEQKSAALREEILADHPSWRGGVIEQILKTSLDLTIRIIASQAGGAKRELIEDKAEGVIEALRAAAERSGEQNKLSRTVMSEVFVGTLVIPTLMLPVRLIIDSQRTSLLLLGLLVVGLPLMLFAGADRWLPGADDPSPAEPTGR